MEARSRIPHHVSDPPVDEDTLAVQARQIHATETNSAARNLAREAADSLRNYALGHALRTASIASGEEELNRSQQDAASLPAHSPMKRHQAAVGDSIGDAPATRSPKPQQQIPGSATDATGRVASETRASSYVSANAAEMDSFPVGSCPGCRLLAAEVQKLNHKLETLSRFVTRLASNVRTQAAQPPMQSLPEEWLPTDDLEYPGALPNSPVPIAPTQQQSLSRHDIATSSRARPLPEVIPSSADPHTSELARAESLKEQVEGMRARPAVSTSAALQDLATKEEVLRIELRVFQKQLLSNLTQLASRLATVEGDVLQNFDELHQLDASVTTRITELANSKLSAVDLKPRVLQILNTTRDESFELTKNLYLLLDLEVPSVQQAVLSSSQVRRDLVLSTPAIKATFDLVCATAQELKNLKRVVEFGGIMKDANAKTMNLFNLLLGIDVADENSLMGVRVTKVLPGGPCHAAGIHTGDVISKINRIPIQSKADFLRVVANVLPNSVVRLARIPPNRDIGDVVEVVASNGGFLVDS